MSIDEFIVELEKTPRTWKLSKSGAIRNVGDCRCPMEVVAKLPFSFPMKAANMLGLNYDLVVCAADDLYRQDKVLRQRMLVACGLEAQ